MSEIKTYEDLLVFLNGLSEQLRRLNSDLNMPWDNDSLRSDKSRILREIRTVTFSQYLGDKGVQSDKTVQGQRHFCMGLSKDSKDTLEPPFEIEAFKKAVEAKFPEFESPEKYISDTLGTHQNWFKWLLSCFFDAPKSKQFIDGYSIFDTNQEKEQEFTPKKNLNKPL